MNQHYEGGEWWGKRRGGGGWEGGGGGGGGLGRGLIVDISKLQFSVCSICQRRVSQAERQPTPTQETLPPLQC